MTHDDSGRKRAHAPEPEGKEKDEKPAREILSLLGGFQKPCVSMCLRIL